MPIDLRHRNLQPERMDQPGLDPAEHARALAGLRRVNWISRTATQVWRPIEQLAHRRRLDFVRVLDLACGGGDLVFSLQAAARRSSVAAQIDGADVSPTAIDYANQRANDGNASFHVLDALNDQLPTDYDVITCTLFLHHLTEEQAISLMRRAAKSARHAVVIDDLIRSRLGYSLAWLGCRLLSRSPIVHYDGPLSVEGAYSVDEVHEMANVVGLAGATITRHWPERFQLLWERPE